MLREHDYFSDHSEDNLRDLLMKISVKLDLLSIGPDSKIKKIEGVRTDYRHDHRIVTLECGCEIYFDRYGEPPPDIEFGYMNCPNC